MSFNCIYNYPQIARDSEFKLHQCRNGFMDWRLIGSLEIETIIREQQFEQIDGVLSYLSEAPLAPALEINILDSSVGKYFFISQLAIQYLIFCRKFLDESVKAIRESLIKAEVENGNLKTLNKELSEEIVQLNKKINQLESINDIIFPCHACTKNFVSNDALNIHIFKKHLNALNDVQAPSNDKALINTIKLELEIKHLKERLNIAEKDIRETSEDKKLYVKQYANISSNTQSDTKNVDIGTQCNLLEIKEIDCSIEDKNSKMFISGLQEKILALESWKESHRFEENDLMTDILKNLQKINEDLNLRRDQNINSLKQIFENSTSALKFPEEIFSAFLKKLQSSLFETVSYAMQQNSETLNTILNKIEISQEEKLYSQNVVSEGKTKTRNKIGENPTNDLSLVGKPNSKVKDLHAQIYSSEEFVGNEKQLSESSHDICSAVSSPSDFGRTKRVTKTTFQNVLANDILMQKLASYGILTDAKTISASEATKILYDMSENKNIKKKNYAFKTTRNKLEKYVNILNINNIHEENVKESLLNYFKFKFVYKKNTLKLVGYGGSDSFKERLENILCSPIKKPYLHDLGYIIEQNKPIPLPRKKVMFHSAPNEV